MGNLNSLIMDENLYDIANNLFFSCIGTSDKHPY